jgi:hypothetical protein
VRVEAAGLAVHAPRGWDVRIYRRPAVEPGAVTQPVLHAANFALPVQRADYGGGVVERMGPHNVFVALLEFDRASATTPLFDRPRPKRLLLETFGPNRLQRVIPGQGGAQFFFNEHGRAFCMYVVIGSYRNRAALVPAASDVAQTLEISP